MADDCLNPAFSTEQRYSCSTLIVVQACGSYCIAAGAGPTRIVRDGVSPTVVMLARLHELIAMQ